jgi:hypothetical protein
MDKRDGCVYCLVCQAPSKKSSWRSLFLVRGMEIEPDPSLFPQITKKEFRKELLALLYHYMELNVRFLCTCHFDVCWYEFERASSYAHRITIETPFSIIFSLIGLYLLLGWSVGQPYFIPL